MKNYIVYSDLLYCKNLSEEIEKLTDKICKNSNKRFSKYASTSKNTLLIAKKKKAKQQAKLKKWLEDNMDEIPDSILADFILDYY